MKKRILALLCAAVMIFMLIPVPANAVIYEWAREGDWVVGVDDRYPNRYMIIGYTGGATNVTLPQKVRSWTVTGVYESAFRDNTKIKTINIPDNMTVYSLYNCSAETINLGANVKLSSGAFSNCSNLKNINLPDGLEVLPANLFKNCTSLTSVTIPEGVKIIGEGAFTGCTGLTELTLPDTVVEINSRAFQDCTNLKSVNIPAGVETIGAEEPFGGCRNLSEIKVDAGNPLFYNDSEGNLCSNETINSVDYVMLVRSVTGNYGDSYTIPSHITGLDRACFTGVGGLKKLVIPNTVTYVDHSIAAGCPDLTEVWLEGRPARFSYGAFYNATLTVYYPGDTGQWDGEDFSYYNGELTWIPYCTGIHKGPVGTVIKEATCTETGTSENICELCGESYIYEIPLEEHSYDEGVVTKEAICMTNGEMTYTCTVCGHFYTERIPCPGHRYDYDNMTIVDPPTCTVKGTRETFCLDCGDRWFGEAPALGHDYSEAVPVYDETGRNHVAYCTRCTAEKSPEACAFDAVVVREATAEEFGLKEYTCTACGGSYQASYVYRISGRNRCATAYAVADELKAVLGVERFDVIIIASGDNFADALAGSCLAARKNAPILLYRDGFADDNLAYIQENMNPGGTVYILGGTASVPQEMEDVLAGFSVKRLYGSSRFYTNLEILREAGVTGGEILVATGYEFADSLSASATGMPILMVNNTMGALTKDQMEYLESLENVSFTIVGGTASVSDELAQALAVYGSVDRVCGTSREKTSVAVAEHYFSDPDRILLAYSRNFPDGLCGGPLAYAMGAPLILTDAGREESAAEYVAKHGITKGAILGGTATISDATAEQVFMS